MTTGAEHTQQTPRGTALFNSCAKAAGDPWHDRAACPVCDTYRYRLTRQWGENPEAAVTWLMLNPSTADADTDDPTVRRCTGFSTAWGYDAMEAVNLYALRATSPRELWSHPDPVGPDNELTLRSLVRAEMVVCAWGNHGRVNGRSAHVVTMLHELGIELWHLKQTGLHQPQHPLYLPNGLRPQRLDVAKFLKRGRRS